MALRWIPSALSAAALAKAVAISSMAVAGTSSALSAGAETILSCASGVRKSLRPYLGTGTSGFGAVMAPLPEAGTGWSQADEPAKGWWRR